MQNFIVLGLVPGTDIQFTFGSWLVLCLSLAALLLVFWLRHHIRAFVLSWYVAHLIRRHKLTLTLQ